MNQQPLIFQIRAFGGCYIELTPSYTNQVANLTLFNCQSEAICDPWLPQFVIIKCNNISEVTERLCMVFGYHSLLWPSIEK